MVDFHSHFLPGIDDGADTVECSLKMLEEYKKQGVNTVVSTSHYYEWQNDVSEFLKKRENSYNELMKEMHEKSAEYPEIILGAEVALTLDIAKRSDLHRLCIGDTDFILIELPYSGYHEWIPYAIFEITSRCNLKPILAHFERFCTSKSKLEQYKSLLSLDVKVQINTESLLYRKPFKVIKHLAKMNAIDVIGSDAHNMDSRSITFADGVKCIEKKFGKDYLIHLNNSAKKILEMK